MQNAEICERDDDGSAGLSSRCWLTRISASINTVIMTVITASMIIALQRMLC